MKKTLIALAVLGAFGAAHASDVTIYGRLNPSYDVMKVENTAANTDASYVGMKDNSSRIGFKGSEDLGGGLKAMFQMESYFNIVDKSGFGGARDSFLGLQGSWGTFKMGAYDPVYKKISAKYDPFGDSIGDYNSIMGQGNGIDLNSRYSNVVGYVSPDMMGFKGMIDYSYSLADEDANGDTKAAKLDLGVTYDNGPLSAFVAYAMQNGVTTTTVPAEEKKGLKIGASYKLPTKTKISAIYENLKQDRTATAGTGSDINHYFLGVQHPINNIDLLATFMYADDNDELTSSANTGAKAYNLGVRYNFSKRTNVMAVYSMVDNDDNASYKNDAGYDNVVTGGSEISGFSVRMQHNF